MVARFLLTMTALGVLAVGLVVWMFLESGGPIPGGGPTHQKSITKRYKVEMTFDVAGETVSGSGVFVGRFTAQTNGMTKQRYAYLDYVSAQGFPMKLKDGRLLLATSVTTARPDRSLNALFLKSCGLPTNFDDGSGDAWLRQVTSFEGKCPLKAGLLPVLLLFPDPAVPRATYIDPEKNGIEVRFVSGYVSTTDEKLNYRLGPILPWLTKAPGDLEVDYGTPRASAFRNTDITTRQFYLGKYGNE